MNWGGGRDRLKKNILGRSLLGLFSLAYGVGVVTRKLLYSAGVIKSHRLRAKVICIGNLTTGGTGKSPAVLLAAQTLRRKNENVAILSRGYGRKDTSKEPCVLLENNTIHWTVCGDEPWMMHRSLHGLSIPILVNSDRVRAGQEAMAYFHSKVLIMDDGFQHHTLKRDLDIVLINARDPFGGGRLLPLGNLREPLSGLARAHLVVLTHVDQVPAASVEKLREDVQALHPEVPIVESIHKGDYLLDLKTDKKKRLSFLKGTAVVAVSGLGDPGGFEGLLTAAGAELVQKWRYPDHHPFSEEEIKSIENVRRSRGAEIPIITTFKDFPRLPENWKDIFIGDVYALGIKLEIVKGKTLWNKALNADPEEDQE